MSETSALLPCPFCGAAGELERLIPGGDNYRLNEGLWQSREVNAKLLAALRGFCSWRLPSARDWSNGAVRDELIRIQNAARVAADRADNLIAKAAEGK